MEIAKRDLIRSCIKEDQYFHLYNTRDIGGAEWKDIPTLRASPHSPTFAHTVEGVGSESFRFRCICGLGYTEGDGTIACNKCDVWQHMACMGVEHRSVPDIYYCDQCNPRDVDVNAARRKVEESRRIASKEAMLLQPQEEQQ